MAWTDRWARWRFVLLPRWLAWHVTVVVAVAGMGWLGDWQFRRAEAGNSLSWGYTFEWPFFAVMAVVFWGKTLWDEAHPPAPREDGQPVPLPAGAESRNGASPGQRGAPGAPLSPEDEELAAYNAYLARLHQQVRGHGKWHGLR